MKKVFPILLVLIMLLCAAACKADPAGQTPQPTGEGQSAAPESASPDTPADVSAEPTETEPAPEGKTLVVFFSATGTTKGVAEKIAAVENADLYEIRAAQEYTAADLDWHDSSSRTTAEQNDPDARPAIGSEKISLAGYQKLYLGYPIWWGEEPRILDTFAESYDFTGLTVIPFCTSGGSGVGRSGQNLSEKAGTGNWLEGRRFSGGVTRAELQSWIESLN